MKNFIILGDSVMKGIVFSKEKNKYKLCKENNFNFLNDYGFNIINKSKMGATIKYCKKIIEDNPELFNNSTVLLSFGGNDCNFQWNSIANNPDDKYLPAVSPNDFKTIYLECIDALKKANAKALITNLVPIDSENYFKWISKGLNQKNILRWLGDEHVLYRWHEHYSSIVNEIATKSSCPLIDIRSPFLDVHEYRKYMCIDGIHPSPEGYSFLSENIKKNYLSEIISSKKIPAIA